MVRSVPIILAALAVASAPRAQERDFCADRPGKGSPPCVLDQGRFQAELGGVDAAFTRGGGVSTDDVSYGVLELRLGLTPTLEGQINWTAHERVRTRDSSGASTVSGADDLGLGLRWSLKNPSGDGVSIAIEPTIVAPTGAAGISAGRWQGWVVVPASIPLSADWTLNLAPQVSVRPNGAGGGRHAGYTLATGVERALGPVTLGAELWVDVDDDPAQRVTKTSLDLTTAWSPKALKDVQLDASAYVGLNSKTPDLELVVGIARRF